MRRLTWYIVITEAELAACSRIASLSLARPLTSHLATDFLARIELHPGGLYAAIRQAAVDKSIVLNPDLAKAPQWPDKVGVTYCNPRRGHIGPGADAFVGIASLQPANAWTVQLTLETNARVSPNSYYLVFAEKESPNDN